MPTSMLVYEMRRRTLPYFGNTPGYRSGPNSSPSLPSLAGATRIQRGFAIITKQEFISNLLYGGTEFQYFMCCNK